MTTEKKERGAIQSRGMGGFLNPPGHPEHTHSVEFDLHRRADDRGSMSLGSAVESEWLDDAIRSRAKAMLDEWASNKASLESEEVQAWVRRVLGYFRGCYRNPEAGAEQWHAGKLIIDQKRDPIANADDHAGVNLIRKYYPEFQPTATHFAEAKWGN